MTDTLIKGSYDLFTKLKIFIMTIYFIVSKSIDFVQKCISINNHPIGDKHFPNISKN